MSHDTFISHSSDDKIIADAVTAALEQAGIRCWIAPRDIRPGDSWGGAIVEAIETSRVMVVIFSAKSNDSKQVMREVERAVQHDVVVVPFRIEDVKPTRDMEYFLSSTHWLDAMTPEMGAHLEELTKTVANILEKPMDAKATAKASKQAAASMTKSQATEKPNKSKLPSILGAAMGVLVLVLAGMYFIGGSDQDSNNNQSAASKPASESTKAQDLKPRESGDIKLMFTDEVRAGAELEIKWKGETADNDYIAIVATDAAESERAGSKPLKGKDALTFEVTDKAGEYEVRFFDAATRKVIARKSLDVLTPEVTLEAPKAGIAGKSIKVAWAGPNDKYDQLVIAKPGTQGRETITTAYIAKGSPTDIRLPDLAGEYMLRYVSGGGREVWKEQEVNVEQPEVAFNIAETQVAGAEIQVDWTGPANKGDYISIAEPQMENKKYLFYGYVREGNKTKLRMPPDDGEFELRYVSGQTAEIWARKRLTIEVPTVSIVSPSQTSTGNTLTMEWQGPANKGDYITIAEPGSEGKKYLSYKYIKKGGKAVVEVPEEPGSYELRYVSAAQGRIWFEAPLEVTIREELISADAEVTAGKKFKVSWQNKGFGGQYIGIFPKGSADDEAYKSYTYTKNKTSNTMTAPKEAGDYELRYMSGGKKQVWARTSLRVIAAN